MEPAGCASGVAKRAGVSPALIYHHFGDRSTLLQSALEHIGEQANAYTEHIEGNSRENLLAGLIDEIQDEVSVRTNSAAWGKLHDTAIFDQGLRPTIATLTQRWVADIADLIRSGQHDGSIASRSTQRKWGCACLRSSRASAHAGSQESSPPNRREHTWTAMAVAMLGPARR